MSRFLNDDMFNEMLRFLSEEHFANKPASKNDLIFLTNDRWLNDTAVIENIYFKNGSWQVCLIFANHKDPLQLIVRHISNCFSEQKPKTAAYYMKRQAAMDTRGTLSISTTQLKICRN